MLLQVSSGAEGEPTVISLKDPGDILAGFTDRILRCLVAGVLQERGGWFPRCTEARRLQLTEAPCFRHESLQYFTVNQ